MTKCEIFLEYFDEVTKDKEIPEEVKEFYNVLRASAADITEKSSLTVSGKMILEYLQKEERLSYKARDIAEALGVATRAINGGIRKLVTDGYVDKIGANPVIYVLSEKGKNYNIKEND